MRGVSRQSEVQSSSSSRGMGTVAFPAPELLLRRVDEEHVLLRRVDEEHETKIDVYSYVVILALDCGLNKFLYTQVFYHFVAIERKEACLWLLNSISMYYAVIMTMELLFFRWNEQSNDHCKRHVQNETSSE